MSKGLWTESETARLLEMVKAGYSFPEIARTLGRPRNSCLGRYHRHLVKNGHIPNPRKRVLEGMAPELIRNTTPKRVYRPKIPPPQVPATGVGFMLPALPATTRQKGQSTGILDVTGCKWPLAEDASVTGGFAFCDASRRDAACPYCEHHAGIAYSERPKPIRKSIGAFGLRFGRAAA